MIRGSENNMRTEAAEMEFLRPAGADLCKQQISEDTGRDSQITKKTICQKEFWITVHGEREWKIYKNIDLTDSVKEVLIWLEWPQDLILTLKIYLSVSNKTQIQKYIIKENK